MDGLHVALSNFKLVFLLIMMFSFQSCLPSRNRSIKEWEKYEWKTLEVDNTNDARNWVSYARKVKGSKFKEFKMVGNINVSPEKAVQIFRKRIVNIESNSSNVPKNLQAIDDSENAMRASCVHRLPISFQKGGVCGSFSESRDDETGKRKITWQEEWDEATDSKKGIRNRPKVQGSWEFIPTDNGQSIATYQLYTEARVDIPASAFNSKVKSELQQKLTRLEALAITPE